MNYTAETQTITIQLPSNLSDLLLSGFFCFALGVLYRIARYIIRTTARKINDANYAPETAIRTIFRNHPNPIPPPRLGNHPHPVAATERNAVMTFLSGIAFECGLEPYVYQMSAADQRKNLRGCRDYYWAKDLSVPIQERKDHPIHDHEMICMVDVDFYVDMNAFLLRHALPVCLYTIEPTAPSGFTHNSSFHFEDNVFRMLVSGGGEYKHKLWHYGKDTIKLSGYVYPDRNDPRYDSVLWRPGGKKWRTVVYTIDRRTMSKHRTVVLLTPTYISDINRITDYGMRAELEALVGTPLTRLAVLDKGYNVIHSVQGDGSRWLAISPDGDHTSYMIPRHVDTAIRAVADRAKATKTGLTAASVESYLEKEMPDRHGAAQVLRTYYAARLPSVPSQLIFPLAYSVGRYQCGSRVDDSARPGLSAFMNPILCPAPAPDDCKANDEHGVRTRITDIATPNIPLTPYMAQAIREFTSELIPVATRHKHSPYSDQAVYERQKRPAQQVTLRNADMTGGVFSRTVRAFQKKEAYGKYNDPRNISTIAGPDKLRYSTYTYALSDHIKAAPWYAFSRTPAEIAARVGHICEGAEEVFLGDFSRMDGRVSNIGRLLTNSIAKSYFHPKYHQELEELLRTQFNCKAVTRNGVFYTTGLSRLSGSPETSLFNTIETAFVIYLAYRSGNEDGRRRTHAESYSKLCASALAGGDDSIAADVSPLVFANAASMVGHKATGETKLRGSTGVNFLARYYSPHVWYGDLNSCSDIKRASMKFHTAVHMHGVLPTDKLVEKSLSVLANDANTPIIGDIARKVMEFGRTTSSTGDTSWWAQYSGTQCYPNKNDHHWMEELLLEQLPEYDIHAMRSWLNSAKRVEDVLDCPIFAADPVLVPPPEFTAVVEGQLIVSQPVSRRKRGRRGKRPTRDSKTSSEVVTDPFLGVGALS